MGQKLVSGLLTNTGNVFQCSDKSIFTALEAMEGNGKTMCFITDLLNEKKPR